MVSHHQLAAATRIGMLTRERDTASACTQALHELRRALPLDAATMLAIDPITGAHLQIAGIGYTPTTSESLAAEFVSTPWYANVVRQTLPPSITEDAEDAASVGQRFRNGWFYAERVRPAGFRDALTGALRHHGRLVGLVNVSIEGSGTYDTEARHLLASILPALGALADPTAHTGDLPDLPAAAGANLVTAEGVIDLPGRHPAEVLADTEFRRLVSAFAESGGHRLRVLWPVGQGWNRVMLRRCTTGSPIARRAVLVSETPTQLPYGLSPRELEVLTRAARGQTNQAVAQALFLSPRTVHSHIEHLLRKTGCASRAEATALAVRDGVLRPTPQDVEHFVERLPAD
ncbi:MULTISPECIES: LuxR C-terminal-related transcriptional regulator [unclassified Streptomyces]|uniref:helix-turn-helix transcriptional regulator n=1 Tax=unclassified Streptomyces TaxID=2593676 RepID=UPI00117E7B0B|nr:MULTISPECIES: LuxR C-terminal-related transcriptional regulator [unclassified Streptomyces]TRO57212.1 response regulator transcription factor [Streptomyces sp. IB201691-2A2]